MRSAPAPWTCALGVAVVGAACQATAPPVPARSPRAVAPAFPEACRVTPGDEGQAPWHWRAGVRCLAARTVDGGLVVLDWAHHDLRRVDGRGREVWRVSYAGDDGATCGAPAGLAVGYDGAVALACGYSMLAFAPDGSRRWQRWPGGDTSVGGPVIGPDGTIYVLAGGTVHALDRDGAVRWGAGPGPGRSASQLGVTVDGQLAFETTAAPWFGDDGTTYHPDDDPELMIVGLDGRVLAQRPRTGASAAAWPAWVPVVDEGGGRIPWVERAR
ncbi:MAG: hypothetical protein IPL61_37500 [Myxococcales bacterium]|nr:hypothetical protein [Myxococcales bacterium]